MSVSKSLGEYALDYAQRGWHVFPCKPSNKAPYIEGGLLRATTDPDIIRDWWQTFPHAMIGVRMGEASGVWGLDPDPQKKPGQACGMANWQVLLAQHGKCAPTHSHNTPSGGLHLLFKWDPDRPLTNSEGMLKGRGINVRGEGGYIIAPPSQRSDGKAYEVVDPLDFFNFADAPDWLYELILTKPAKEQLSISQRALQLVTAPRDARPYAEAALRGETDLVATAAVDRNNQLNTSAMKLGQLVAAGELSEGEVIGALYDASVANGYVASDGNRATMATINSGLKAGMQQPRAIPDRQSGATMGSLALKQEPAQNEAPQIRATPYVWKNPETIPIRQWIYGTLLIRKFVTATVAPGGVGKSSLIAAETLAQVAAKPLLGITPAEPLRVWLWNLEDPQEETERKLQAAALHYGLEPEDIGDRLFVDSGRDQRLVIAVRAKDGAMIVRPVVDALVEEIQRRKIDAVVIDPFVSCHEASENDNPAQDMIVKEWGRVADRCNCSIHLVDHTRKMGAEIEVTTESARGGKAKTDACRVVRAVTRMTKEEGEKAGVSNHRLYFRTLNDKANLQPPADKSDWFQLNSVSLGNGPLGSPGDSVGVVLTWAWPDPMANVTGADFDRVAAVIRRGKWRDHPQAAAWVGRAIAEALELNVENKADKAKINGMLKVWKASGSLVVVKGFDEHREERNFVQVREDA